MDVPLLKSIKGHPSRLNCCLQYGSWTELVELLAGKHATERDDKRNPI